MNNGADGNGVGAVFVGDHHRLLGDPAYAHDRRVGLVDDGKTEDGAKLAGVRDGKGGAFDILGPELLVSRALAEIGDAALQAEEIEISGILEDRDDESPVEGNG